jgi:hypothetical protein
MPRISGQTDAASSFLRSFRTSPSGPPPEKWPPPAVLRRWLRRPSFRAAFASLQDTLRVQADFHVATASSRAALTLTSDTDPQSEIRNPQSAMQLLRLSHVRQRFAATNHSTIPEHHDDDVGSSSPEREITRLDILRNIHLLEPTMRLTKDELRHVAWGAGYPMHLRDFKEFPPPTPQDSFYYYLIMEPSALLWYFKLYGEKTGDYRHSPITASCKQLIPKEYPGEPPLPRFPPEPPTTPPSTSTPTPDPSSRD